MDHPHSRIQHEPQRQLQIRTAPPAGDLEVGLDGWTHSGLRTWSTNLGGFNGPVIWNANAYFSQGIAGVTLNEHLGRILMEIGINPGEAARAIGALTDLTWTVSSTTNINLRAAGQLCFCPTARQHEFFSLGSDIGPRGLPGSLTAGDSGYLGTAELEWTAWQQDNQSVALIPFVGDSEEFTTEFSDETLEDNIGVGGSTGRYRNGRWAAEPSAGPTRSTPMTTRGPWNDWIPGHGLYTKVRYSCAAAARPFSPPHARSGPTVSSRSVRLPGTTGQSRTARFPGHPIHGSRCGRC